MGRVSSIPLGCSPWAHAMAWSRTRRGELTVINVHSLGIHPRRRNADAPLNERADDQSSFRIVWGDELGELLKRAWPCELRLLRVVEARATCFAGRSRFKAMNDRYGSGIEPALELWMDGDGAAGNVRVVGVLDRPTVKSFENSRSDLVCKNREITVDVADVEISGVEGMQALVYVQRLARMRGTQFRWSRMRMSDLRSASPLGLTPRARASG